MELRIVRHTTEFDAACAFYAQLLGWPVTREWPAGDGQGRGRIFGYGDVGRLEFIEQAPHVEVGGIVVAVQVDDVEALHAKLASAGVEILRGLANQPWGHRNFSVKDPTGLEVTFFQVVDPD